MPSPDLVDIFDVPILAVPETTDNFDEHLTVTINAGELSMMNTRSEPYSW